MNHNTLIVSGVSATITLKYVSALRTFHVSYGERGSPRWQYNIWLDEFELAKSSCLVNLGRLILSLQGCNLSRAGRLIAVNAVMAVLAQGVTDTPFELSTDVQAVLSKLRAARVRLTEGLDDSDQVTFSSKELDGGRFLIVEVTREGYL